MMWRGEEIVSRTSICFRVIDSSVGVRARPSLSLQERRVVFLPLHRRLISRRFPPIREIVSGHMSCLRQSRISTWKDLRAISIASSLWQGISISSTSTLIIRFTPLFLSQSKKKTMSYRPWYRSSGKSLLRSSSSRGKATYCNTLSNSRWPNCFVNSPVVILALGLGPKSNHSSLSIRRLVN